MADTGRVHAPYNFAPFSQRVLLPYGSAGELPARDAPRPDLKSGEIHLTLRAETPVFVSSGGQDPHFLRGPDGRPRIPGSTVRGLVRENLQILGLGRVRAGEDLEDYQIYFRKIAAPRDSVGRELNQYYYGVLGVETRRSPSGRPQAVPLRVQAGYIRLERNGYQIYPTQAPCLRVSRRHPDAVRLAGSGPRAGFARAVRVLYREEEGRVTRILPLRDGGAPGLRPGTLLFTGRWVGSVPNSLYLFPEADWSAPPTPLPQRDALFYAEDWERRRSRLGAYYDPDFWRLPRAGEVKPVFYAQCGNHVYCGMSRFLRIGYRFPLSHGLPEAHATPSRRVDYPRALLGFAERDGAYRSRVSFGDFPAVGTPEESPPVPMILSEPKPSYYPGYVEPRRGGGPLPRASHYNEEDFQLRGYKQYWLQPVRDARVPPGRERIATVLRPLPAGTEFRGILRFENLTDLELGLLLWSLRLEEGCFQALGMGKPYGYGRIRVRVDALRVLDPEQLYGGDLEAAPWRDETDRVAWYIDAYDRRALAAGGAEDAGRVRDLPEIQDFLFLRRPVAGGVEATYMDPSAYRNIREPLPTVRDLREPPAPKDAGDPPRDSAGNL